MQISNTRFLWLSMLFSGLMLLMATGCDRHMGSTWWTNNVPLTVTNLTSETLRIDYEPQEQALGGKKTLGWLAPGQSAKWVLEDLAWGTTYEVKGWTETGTLVDTETFRAAGTDVDLDMRG